MLDLRANVGKMIEGDPASDDNSTSITIAGIGLYKVGATINVGNDDSTMNLTADAIAVNQAFDFIWTGSHTWDPDSNAVPITINAPSSVDMQDWVPAAGLNSVMTSGGNFGVGEPTPTAMVSIRNRGGTSADTILAMSPGFWISAPISLTAYADNETITTNWPDISGNNRHMVPFPTNPGGQGPQVSTSSLAINSQRAVFCAGSARTMTMTPATTGFYGISGGYTVYVVWRAQDAPNVNNFAVVGDHIATVSRQDGLLFPAQGSANPYRIAYNTGPGDPGNAISSNVTPASGSANISVIRRNADNSHTVIHNGTDVSSGGFTSSADFYVQGLFCIDADSFANGTNAIAEMIVFPVTHTPAEVATVLAYLGNPYNPSLGGGGISIPLTDWKDSSGVIDSIVSTAINWGIGTASPASKFHIIKTTEQLRIGYDTSNYYKTTVGSTGIVTFDAVGAGSSFVFNDPVNIAANGTGQSLYIPFTTDSTTGIYFAQGSISSTTPVAFIHNYTNPTGFTNAADVNNLFNARNTFIGFRTGNFTMSGTSVQGKGNSGVGMAVLTNLTSGSQNDAMGWGALFGVTSGTENAAFGTLAGDLITTGTKNTLLGGATDVNTNSRTGATAVGYGAIVDADNKMMLGGSTQTAVELKGTTLTLRSIAYTLPSAGGLGILHNSAGNVWSWSAIDLASADVTGILTLNKGGTNANLTAVNGAVVYSTATAFGLTAAGSTGQLLRSAGAASPTWTTATFPATAAAGDLLYGSATNVWSNRTIGSAGDVLQVSGGVPVWASFTTAGIVPTSRTLTAGAGLTGGGDLSADRTFDVGAGTGITVNANDVALTIPVVVSSGGTGATTLTGLLQGNGTSPFTAITNSSTVGQVLRVTGAATYAWGALDLADTDAITNDLPYANLTPASAASRLLGRGSASAGDWQEITLGTGLTMTGTVLSSSGGGGSSTGSDVALHRLCGGI